MFSVALNGFLLGISLIAAIGAQNIFVIRRGLAKDHVFIVCIICFVCDFILMCCGIFGVGEFIGKSRVLSLVLATGGVGFLVIYGIGALMSAFKGEVAMKISSEFGGKTGMIVAQTLGVTLLNPHVYLDTVVIIGAIGAGLNSNEKAFFLLGSVFASFLWFFFARIRREYA